MDLRTWGKVVFQKSSVLPTFIPTPVWGKRYFTKSLVTFHGLLPISFISVQHLLALLFHQEEQKAHIRQRTCTDAGTSVVKSTSDPVQLVCPRSFHSKSQQEPSSVQAICVLLFVLAMLGLFEVLRRGTQANEFDHMPLAAPLGTQAMVGNTETPVAFTTALLSRDSDAGHWLGRPRPTTDITEGLQPTSDGLYPHLFLTLPNPSPLGKKNSHHIPSLSDGCPAD